MKILISEVIWNEGIESISEDGVYIEYDKDLWKKREELLEKVADCDALIVRNQTRVDQDLLAHATNLKVVGRLGVGLDNIDLNQTQERNIKVVAAKNANATSVAEYVLSAILDFNRPLAKANEDVKKGNWNRQLHTGKEVKGKTLGLIGLGEISHRVANRAQTFGIEVMGYDPFVTNYDHVIDESGVKKAESLSDVLTYSDFISLHVPLTSHTKYMISYEAFNKMKPQSIIINSSRGGIIDEEALYEAIRDNKIAGAYLDVLEKEPIEKESPLLILPNIVITPHIAGLTEESQVRTSILVANEVMNILKGEGSLCLV
ncbi:hydroxyacid dehydrogenase [Bacillus sp. FJAT-44742]|uniref:hydroxyacid dehydrogenase n=1 Tax=Bacillus sp. FJAT-44742 TaxID=2014005 RepID=UPI000C231D53|nr:hydroxyacid dehydrogenase [Bacillus sp. FJAT-44742]